jgi:small-conductance mechanosensitive channel
MNRYQKSSWLLLMLLLTIRAFNPAPAEAQEQPSANGQAPAPVAAPSPEDVIQAKIDELQPRIKSFAEAETEVVAKGLNVTLEQLRERTEVLRETRAFHAQHLQARHKFASLLKEKAVLQDKIATGQALKLEEDPPYSLKVYDEFNARYIDSKRNRDTTQLALAVAENALQDARDRSIAAAAQARALRDLEGQGNDPREKLRNQWLYRQAEREEGLSRAVLDYQEQVLINARLEAELAVARVDLARQLSERIRDNLHFDQTDLDQQLAAIDESKKEVETRIDATRRELRRVGREVIRAQRQVEQANDDSEIAAAKATLAVAEQCQQAYRVMLEQDESILQQMGARKQIWKQRYDLIKGAIKREDLAGLREEAVKLRDRLRQTVSLEQERQTSLQLQIGKMEDRLQQEGLSWDAKSNLNEQRQALVELVTSTINYLTALNKTGQMNLQFIEELDQVLQAFSLGQTIKVVFAKIKTWWDAEIFVVDDQALTVRKVVIALGILTFGIILAGILSRHLQKRLLHNLRFSTSTAAITSKLIHYTVVLVIIFLAMRIVNIPLAAFTFMGGAIALGVGFGAQKLINNFISGFIIMAEQPIKVGDLIMINDEQGWIEDIGVRSTLVRTYANVTILVPNSYFLENNITNWTHNDNLVRGQVVVGVTYGSPTREVKEILLGAAAEHGEVVNDPEPYVWFADFADNSLRFELYFWVMVHEKVGIQRVSSDLRFMIEHKFGEAGITVAFPQRDLHFDPDRPLRVELVGESTNPGGPEPALSPGDEGHEASESREADKD